MGNIVIINSGGKANVMRIPLKDVLTGMVLSEDIVISDKVLLHRSEKLDLSSIPLLQNNGINEVSVFEHENNDLKKGEHEAVGEEEPIAFRDDLSSKKELLGQGPQDVFSSIEPIQQSLKIIPPEIHITIDKNRMTAQLVLEKVEGSSSAITSDVILSALAAHSIVYGINTARIDDMVKLWVEHKERFVVQDIALGEAARPAIEGPVKMLVRHLVNPSDCEKVKQASFFHDVFLEFPNIERVSAGMAIAKRTIVHPATPGIDIFGNAVIMLESVQAEMQVGENAVANDDDSGLVAQCDGVAYKIDTTIGIIPVNFNGAFSIEISSDRMIVKCNIIPPGPQGILPGKQVILEMLRDASVHYGINEDDIDTMLILCTQGNYPAEPVVIARGLSPINGSDGSFICQFPTETSLAPSINSDGSADYRSVNIVTTVERNQQLAILMPPGAGHDGSDVFGKILPAQPGKPANLPRGAHTVPDPDNQSVLIADIDGIVRMNGGLVEVCEGFIVKGNVDFSTGNIDYGKTVVVNGDVKSGFKIHSGADLQIDGTIEDCHINAIGNVLCRCGFVGQGKGVIEAKGDVNLSFIKNQCVKSFKTINIAKEAINSTLQSRNSIVAHGKPLSVAGGELKARNTITVYTVGNHTGIRTLLEAGVDFLIVDELLMIEKQITDTTANFKILTEAFSRYQKLSAAKKIFSATEHEKFNELTGAFKQARQKLSVLEERKTIVSGKIYNVKDARIIIQHAAYPGTLFKIGDRHHSLQEELIGPKTVVYTNDEITIY